MHEQLILVGIIAIFIGFALIIIGTILSQSKPSSKTKTEWGFFGLIGFIPIGFGSSKTALFFAAIIAIVFMILFIVLNLIK
jgi:uncharacterized protein (TIGR00304 family)